MYTNKKQIFILLDPEEPLNKDSADREILHLADAILLGGSTLKNDFSKDYINHFKGAGKTVIGFPGSSAQVWEGLDSILYMSLISGRNPQYLIEEPILAAKKIQELNLPTLPTAYILIDGGKETTVNKVSKTEGLRDNQNELFESIVLCAKHFGFQNIYLEAGSGALRSVRTDWVKTAKSLFKKTVIVGGGIRTGEQALNLWEAGADILVIGNGVTKEESELKKIIEVKTLVNQKSNHKALTT